LRIPAAVGVVDGQSLASLARTARASGVSTTTIGFGEGFDEEVLTAMADAGLAAAVVQAHKPSTYLDGPVARRVGNTACAGDTAAPISDPYMTLGHFSKGAWTVKSLQTDDFALPPT